VKYETSKFEKQLACLFSRMFGLAANAAPSSAAVISQNNKSVDSKAISQFVSDFGTPIIMGDKPLSPNIFDSENQTDRLVSINNLSNQAKMTWRKIYRITPAESDAQVTTESQAAEMVDSESNVDLALITAPAVSIEKLLAKADRAYVSYPDGVPKGNVTIELNNANTSEAIAALAKKTHTHWLAAFYLAPILDQNPSLTNGMEGTSKIASVSYQNYEQNNLNNGPFIIHTAPPAPMPTEPVASFDGSDKNNQPAQLNMPPNDANNTSQNTQAQPVVQEPMVPAIVQDPYGYNGLMYAPQYAFSGSPTVINPFGN
jgi:hypothetical protein